MAQKNLTQMASDIASLKPIEASAGSGGIDFEKFHMQPVEIEKVSIVETMKGYVNDKLTDLDEPRKQLLVESVVLEHGKDKEGKEFEIRAKEWFSLIEKDDGTIGWSTHEKASLNKFLKAMRVKSPQELKGKKVPINVVAKENAEGQKKHILRFMY